jgi:hypothetical protein
VITINAGFARIPAKAAIAKLSAADWAVLHVIGLHADKDGRAFPSMARVAEIIGIKRKNIPRTVARLVQRGLLRRHRVPRPAGGWVNQYEMVFEAIGVLNPDEATGNERVLNGEDTGRPEHVLSTEDTHTEACPQNEANRVPTGEALTDQGTVLTKKGKKGRIEVEVVERETVNGGRVLNAEDMPRVLNTEDAQAAEHATDPGKPNGAVPAHCLWPLGPSCPLPVVAGMRFCATHAKR